VAGFPRGHEAHRESRLGGISEVRTKVLNDATAMREVGLTKVPVKTERAEIAYILGVCMFSLQMVVDLGAVWQLSLVGLSVALMCAGSLLALDGSRIDATEALLAVRVIWLVVPMLAFGGSSWRSYLTGSFFSAVIAIVAYSSVRRCSMNEWTRMRVRLVLAVCLMVIVSQSLFAFSRHADIASFAVRKYYVDIPFGNSNSIAMIVSTLGLYLAYSAKRSRERVAWIVLVGVSAVVLSSFGNFLLLAAFAAASAIPRLRRTRLNSGVVGVLLIGVSITMSLVALNSNSVEDFLNQAFSDVGERANALQAGDLDAVTTQRTLVYAHYVTKIVGNPLVGYGTQPVSGGGSSQYELMRPHNLVLEAVYQGGVVNLILYLGAVVAALRSLRKTPVNRAVKVAVLFLLLDSMIEPGLFALNKDFVFWTILGIGIRTGTDGEGRSSRSELQQCNQDYRVL